MIGTEQRDEYLAVEATAAAHKLVTEVRPSAGKQVLITADTSTDSRVVRAVAGAVHAVGGTATVVSYHTLPEPMRAPPAPVQGASLHAEIWFNFAVAYQLYSPAYHGAVNNGCVYVELTGMDIGMLVRTVGRVSHAPMEAMKRWLYRRSQAARTVRVTTPAGTDMTMSVDPGGDAFWEDPPSEGGFPQMLGGQSGFMAYRESYGGELVFDGALWPPADLGLLTTPVKLTLKGGYVRSIDGGPEALRFERWLKSFDHPEVFLMDHACYGFNPGVTAPTGRILEDERVFGCMQFGVGATEYGSPAHTDGVCLNPTVWLDDERIEEEGRFVHPELVAFCRAMGAPGYET